MLLPYTARPTRGNERPTGFERDRKRGMTMGHEIQTPEPAQLLGSACALCGRDGVHLTRHHLIPRMRHRNKRTRRNHGRVDLLQQIIRLCRPCHDQVHRTLSEKALAEHYCTREALLQHPDIVRFCAWIASRPAGFSPKGRGKRRYQR